jgi:pilus assembly protein CpaB
MVMRIIFFALMAFGLVGFGTVAWISSRPPPASVAASQPPPAKVAVLAAARPLHAGSLLKPEDLTSKEISVADRRPDMSANNADERRGLAGAMVRRSLSVGEPVRAGDVMRPGDHGFLAAVLMPGMRAVTVGVDATTGAAGLIWPGDRVDLILTQTIQQAALAPGHSVAAETVLSDVRVIAINQQLVQGGDAGTGDGQARTVTLEVTQDQAERVSVATRLGRLSLSVRSAETSPDASAKPSSGPNTTWAVDVSPALGAERQAPAQNTIHVYQGSAEAKEFKF